MGEGIIAEEVFGSGGEGCFRREGGPRGARGGATSAGPERDCAAPGAESRQMCFGRGRRGKIGVGAPPPKWGDSQEGRCFLKS